MIRYIERDKRGRTEQGNGGDEYENNILNVCIYMS